MAHAFNPSTWEAEAPKFKASLVYKVSCRTARAIQRNPDSKKKKKKKKKFGREGTCLACRRPKLQLSVQTKTKGEFKAILGNFSRLSK